MKLTRLLTFSLAATFALVACGGDKVKPDDAAATADAALTPEQKEAKQALDYQKKQSAFADSVLGNAKSAVEVAKKYGANVQVGTVQMRDSITKYVSNNPQCFKSGRDLDPYLAGTVTFYVHMSVIGSDVIRVQTSEWTSQAGNAVDKCFNEITPKWKLPMGMAKQGQYMLQVQFK
jgi:hypothetical protein